MIRPGGFLVKLSVFQIYLLVTINSNHGVTLTDMTAATAAVLFPSEKATSHSRIFDIPMRPMRPCVKMKDTENVLPVKEGT